MSADPSAMVRAREAIADLAPLMDEGRWRDLRIAVSELVANAIRHGSPEGGHVEVVLDDGEADVRVEVYDDGAGFLPEVVQTRGDEEGGWGLYIVDLVATRWGVESEPRSCVWFVLPRRDASATEPV
jgi:anti-sigma regulatory factor (Ser/Thr protein kinase)